MSKKPSSFVRTAAVDLRRAHGPRLECAPFVVAALIQACGSPSEVDRLSENHQDLVNLPPSEYVDPKGNVWMRVGDKPAPIASREEEEAQFRKLAEGDTREDTVEAPDFSAMAVDDIAELLRGQTIRSGFMYLAAPNYELAERIKEFAATGALHGPLGFQGFGEGQLSKPDVPPEFESDLPDSVIDKQLTGGVDNRALVRANTSFPFSAQILLTDTSGGGGSCSATMIGPSTALTAAHCVRTTSAFLSTRGWAPGVDHQDANQYSFNPMHTDLDLYPHSNAHRVNGCYSVYAPAYDGSVATDYAILEFDKDWWNGAITCGETVATMDDKPGYSVGYVPADDASASVIEAETLYLYGYPGNSEGCLGGTCNWPSIWGHGTGSPDPNAESQDVIYSNDATGGQSGAGLYFIDGSGNRFVVSIHRGGVPGLDRNWGRRVSTSLITVIEANSEL